MTGLGYSRGNYTMTQYNEIYDANSKGILLYRFLTADGIPNGDTGSAGVGNFTLSGSDLMPLKFYYNDPCNATDTFAACTQMADEATQKAFSWTLSMIKVLPANVF